jgi:hypothetical protein
MPLKLPTKTYTRPPDEAVAGRGFCSALLEGMASGTLLYRPSPDYGASIARVTPARALSETTRRIVGAACASLPHD